MPRTRLYFDGGCRPNPGPIETAVVVRGIAHVRTGLPPGDNNLAEWLALLWAAEIAVDLRLADALFVGDSALVIDQARGALKCRAPALADCHARFLSLTAALPGVALRQVRRAKNLAGIALQRRHDRPFEIDAVHAPSHSP